MNKVNYKKNNRQVCFGRVNLMTSLMNQISSQNPSVSRREICQEVCQMMSEDLEPL